MCPCFFALTFLAMLIATASASACPFSLPIRGTPIIDIGHYDQIGLPGTDGTASWLGIGRGVLSLFAVDDAPGRPGTTVIVASIHWSLHVQPTELALKPHHEELLLSSLGTPASSRRTRSSSSPAVRTLTMWPVRGSPWLVRPLDPVRRRVPP